MLDPSTDHAAHMHDCPRCGDQVTCPDFQGEEEHDDEGSFYCSQRCADAAREAFEIALYERVGSKGMEHRYGPQRP